mgnify:CR=1 FL=1
MVHQASAVRQRAAVGRWEDEKWKGVRIPRLADELAAIPGGGRLFIEVKCGPESVPDLAKAFKRYGKKPKQLVVISFNYEVVKQAKARLPKIECFYLSSFKVDEKTGEQTPRVEKLIAMAKAAKLEGINVNYKGLGDKAFFEKVMAAGLELFTWTVNSPEEAKRLSKLGINGITTDRPAWLRGELSK